MSSRLVVFCQLLHLGCMWGLSVFDPPHSDIHAEASRPQRLRDTKAGPPSLLLSIHIPGSFTATPMMPVRDSHALVLRDCWRLLSSNAGRLSDYAFPAPNQGVGMKSTHGHCIGKDVDMLCSNGTTPLFLSFISSCVPHHSH